MGSTDDTSKTHAYGKLILFGEHFVVYHVPALVGAVSAYTDCQIEEKDDGNKDEDEDVVEIIDNRPAVPNYKIKKAEEGKHAIQLVLNHLKLTKQQQSKMKIIFSGNLCAVSGIGASAAQVVSLSRALNIKYFNSQMTEDEINTSGYEGEKGYHGTPSGIDNTASTFGGLLHFQRTDSNPIFIKKQLKVPIRIVYASTGITASTTEVVNDVRTKKNNDEKWFNNLLEQYKTIVEKAEIAIDTNDLQTLGTLLNENHTLCQQLTVSCKELDTLVDTARTAGAWGAKMSGTGRGGLMLALTPTEELQTKVADALTPIAPQVWKTTFS